MDRGLTDYLLIEAPCTGFLNERCVGDRWARPPVLERLGFTFETSCVEDLVESMGFYLASKSFEGAVKALAAKGVSFDSENVEVIGDSQFIEIFSSLVPALSDYSWMKVTGTAGVDDFGYGPDWHLVVSRKVWEAMKKLNTQGCVVSEWMD